MKRVQSGFTLIELMIVVAIIAIIAIIAAIAIPNLLSARLNANETSAISTLRNISSAQSQFQASAKADVDGDGTGEFGMFQEMSGAIGVRTSADGSTVGSKMNPPVLSGAFRRLNQATHPGSVPRSGYHFRMILPGTPAQSVIEEYAGGSAIFGTVNTDMAETTWCAYATPANYSTSGNRTFFVNQTGDITSKDDAASTDTVVGSTPGIAFKAGGLDTSITGQVAVGTKGRDGKTWKQVN